MFKGLTDMVSMMRQAKQLGGQLEGMQHELRRKRVRAEAGGGMVAVEVNGLGELAKVEISDELLAKQDGELISSLIVSAAAQAQKKAQETATSDYMQIASNLGLGNLGQFFESQDRDDDDTT